MPDTRLKSIKVVAVDDNADSRALLKVILKLGSADEAAVMSEMDGYELLENVRRLEPEPDVCLRLLLQLQLATKIGLRPNEQVSSVFHETDRSQQLVTTILKVALGH